MENLDCTANCYSINVNYENLIHTEHVLALFEDVLKEYVPQKKSGETPILVRARVLFWGYFENFQLINYS